MIPASIRPMLCKRSWTALPSTASTLHLIRGKAQPHSTVLSFRTLMSSVMPAKVEVFPLAMPVPASMRKAFTI